MNMRKICAAALALTSITLLPVSASAAEIKNETAITLDFQNRQIQFFGIYSPAKSSARAQGLEAEIVARRNGIAHLNSQLTRGCEGTQNSKPNDTAVPSWQGAVKSQGSEIYANGVLKISLVAPLRDVLKSSGKKSNALKSKDGSPLALKLPRLPVTALKCGVLNVSLGGKSVNLNPLSGSTESGAKVVNLSLDGASGLRPASSADLALLENSNLLGGGESTASAAGSDSPATDATGSAANPSQPPAGATQQNPPAN
ncbi:MAG: hypothetical protein RLZZ488_894 [Pseudomonadota bacterium]|jgi:hypothetical protein